MSATMHIKTTVLPNGKIEIDTPNIAAGTVVTVTITVEEAQIPAKRHVIDILADMPGHCHFKTAEEVDAYLREERYSWE